MFKDYKGLNCLVLEGPEQNEIGQFTTEGISLPSFLFQFHSQVP